MPTTFDTIVILLVSSTLLFFKQFFVFILGNESGSVNRFGYPMYCCCQQLKFFFCRFGRKKSIIASLILAAIGAFASVLIESEGGGSKGENNQYPNTVYLLFPGWEVRMVKNCYRGFS